MASYIVIAKSKIIDPLSSMSFRATCSWITFSFYYLLWHFGPTYTLQRDSGSGTAATKAPSQQMRPAVNPVKGGISFILPVFSCLSWVCHVVSPDFLSWSHFPFSHSPSSLCDLITPLDVPRFPSGVVTCALEQMRAAHLLAPTRCRTTPSGPQ